MAQAVPHTLHTFYNSVDARKSAPVVWRAKACTPKYFTFSAQNLLNLWKEALRQNEWYHNTLSRNDSNSSSLGRRPCGQMLQKKAEKMLRQMAVWAISGLEGRSNSHPVSQSSGGNLEFKSSHCFSSQDELWACNEKLSKTKDAHRHGVSHIATRQVTLHITNIKNPEIWIIGAFKV